MSVQLKSVIRLRRDTLENYEPIEKLYAPMSGEVCLIVTPDGTKAKIGDGTTKLADLEYFNEVVARGYYLNNKFWTDSTYTKEIPGSLDKIFINSQNDMIYTWNGTAFKSFTDILPVATDEIAGILKLYKDGGLNEDGTMTQKAITEGVNAVKFDILEDDEECLVLETPWSDLV